MYSNGLILSNNNMAAKDDGKCHVAIQTKFTLYDHYKDGTCYLTASSTNFRFTETYATCWGEDE